MAAGQLRPLAAIPSSESDTGISDPKHNVAPVPDYTQDCFAGGIDNSPSCLGAVLQAINHAHALEGIRPMVLPADFAQLSIPDQLFVAVNLERVDRGLPAFGGLTTALNRNAQRGADIADDPPDPGQSYDLDDAEWAGGSSNGLDADYGWMYDDGFDSGNLDCLHRGAAGCWGHRKGILDDFGSGPNLVMGAAISMHDDTHSGDQGRHVHGGDARRRRRAGHDVHLQLGAGRAHAAAIDGLSARRKVIVMTRRLSSTAIRHVRSAAQQWRSWRSTTCRPTQSATSTSLRPWRTSRASCGCWTSTTRA